jgi:signal transduction histidine kinase
MAATISSRHEFESGAVLQAQAGDIRAAREDLLQLDVMAFRPQGSDVVATTNRTRRLPFTREDVLAVRKGRVVSRASGSPAGTHVDVMAPITVDGEIAGAVGARFSSALQDRLTHRMRVGGFVLTGVSVVVMGLLINVAVRYVVDRPVRSFLRAIGKIRDGDTAATVETRTGDEFGVLAQHFNGMVSRVRRFNDELRLRVEEATRELEGRYQQVQQLHGQLFELQRRLAHAERLAISGRIMAEVAHEVGTPLHSVSGHLELLRRDLPAGGLSDDVTRRLTVIEAQVSRVIEIIAHLLDLTRRPAGELQRVDLNRLVREMVELVGPGTGATGLTLGVETAGELPPVLGYPDQLRQVILNLLTNAIDATPAGGRISVSTGTGANRHEVTLTVSDTGPGIRDVDRPRLFEPFFSTKPPGQGTGLGLFIAAQIVRDHKGRIDVTSADGNGGRFCVIIPAAPAAT